MEGIETILKTAQSPALIMALAWIFWLNKRLEKAEEALERERAKNEKLTDIIKDVCIGGQKATASALRQIKRLLDPRNAEETGEFNATDFPRIS